MTFRLNLFLFIAIIMAVTGCARKIPVIAPPQPEAVFRVDISDIDFTDDLDMNSLDLAIERSLHYYNGAGRNDVYRLAGRLFKAGQMQETLQSFRQIIKDSKSPDDMKDRISRDFDAYRAAGQDGKGGVLFTGYYEPLLTGSLTPTEQYKYPLYRTPPDLSAIRNTKSVPYYSRREIDAGGILRGQNLEIAWVADPVDLFFLHIQGSGKIKLENGKLLTVGVDNTNGRPYRPTPGSVLDQVRLDKGNASYKNVKAWLKDKSIDELYEILSYYERYIFFRFVDKDPIGSLGEPVTPSRSIATDPDLFPPGALAFIRLSKPVSGIEGNAGKRVAFSRFVLNQDKGSAIKGPGRVDLFCGFGETAEAIAGSLKEKGELYFLIKK
jgi:membrane-bound lytic murein transglycosylase A